jgi:hypothetical protein
MWTSRVALHLAVVSFWYVSFGLHVRAQESVDHAKIEAAKRGIRHLIQERNEAVAKRDRAALERIFAEDFVFIHSLGYIVDRENQIDDMLSLERPVPLLVYGDIAIHRNIGGIPGAAGNPTGAGTWVYVRTGERWRAVQAQTTELQPARTYVSVPDDVLDTYVGKYDRGGGMFDVVTREGSKLILQWPGFRKFELMPTSHSRFFDRTGGEWTFHKDASGRVSYLLQMPRRGSEVKRVKVE